LLLLLLLWGVSPYTIWVISQTRIVLVVGQVIILLRLWSIVVDVRSIGLRRMGVGTKHIAAKMDKNLYNDHSKSICRALSQMLWYISSEIL